MKHTHDILLTEEKLLIQLCRLKFSESDKALIKKQAEGVTDWDKFVDLANKHGVIALCRYNLNETGNSKNIPAEKFERLRSAYLKNLTRNTFIYSFYLEIASLAKEQNIRIVVLKGLALEKRVYGNMGLRQMTDLDILAAPEDAMKLRELLLRNGFESAPFVSKVYEKHLFYEGKHLPEMYKKGLSAEIHIRLFDQSDNSLTRELFNTANLIPGEKDIYCPGPRMFFLYLIKHLDKHEKEGTSQLRLYADLVVLLEQYYDEIVNEKLFSDAKKADLESALQEKLKILNIYWGITFPSGNFAEESDFEIRKIHEKFIRFLRNPQNQEKRITTNPLRSLKFIPGTINKLFFIAGFIFPSPEYIRYNYRLRSGLIGILYYPVWWFEIISRIIRIK